MENQQNNGMGLGLKGLSASAADTENAEATPEVDDTAEAPAEASVQQDDVDALISQEAGAAPAMPTKSIAPKSDAIPEAAMVDSLSSMPAMEQDKGAAIFMSKHKSLTVHIMVPLDKDYVTDVSGRPRRTSIPLEFKNGIFKTDNPDHIKGLEEAMELDGQLFRRATDLQTAAVLEASYQKAAELDGGVQGGVATAGLNDGATVAMQARLRQMQDAAFEGASS